jgi:DNA-binding response OmpR family regulator
MHLAKPIDPGELAASVATLMRRARSAGSRCRLFRLELLAVTCRTASVPFSASPRTLRE